MPSLNQRPSEFERTRVPAVETPFEFRRAKEPSMKRSLVGRVNAWRRRYLRTRRRTGNARSTSWILKAIPAAQVCERARIAARAALTLQEIGSRLVLPGLVVFELGRGGNGVGVIKKTANWCCCHGQYTVRTQRKACPSYLFTADVFGGFLLDGPGTSQTREGPKGRMAPFCWPEPRRLCRVIPLGGGGDKHG